MRNGIDWLHQLSKTYQYWKAFQSLPEVAKQKRYWPSETYCKYPKDSTFEGRTVLNIGCGTCTYQNEKVVNLDGYEGEGVNVVWDLSRTPLPFKDNEFDLILANHVIEHIPNWFECFKELTRITKVGGRIEVWIPPVSSDSSFTYRDHINSIGVESFWGCLNFARISNNLWATTEARKQLGNVANVRIVSMINRPAMYWWLLFVPNWVTEWCTKHLRNVVSETGFIFRKESHSNA